ncbi:unnamed protein product [Paramecium sonneborni]|uniref:Ubiquitin carboxyl-terminal hydrolase n=1 Tax=Paramecium sonneborni TaxID=65129 RepID=A0A8S1M210_9CILI|nr:unnamed protein product [Paramecium sonneborni]
MQFNQIDDSLYKKYIREGYSDSEIQNAWKKSQGNIYHLDQWLKEMKNESYIINQSSPLCNDYNFQMTNTVSLIIHQQQVLPINIREYKIPCGLLNLGNTCYFNSLLQSYYAIYDFVSQIMKCKFDHININNIVDKKIQNSIKLLQHLQNLFVLMIGSDRQFINPKEVILSIYDDFGNQMTIGDQKDVCEFNHYFLSRIDEGLTYLTQQLQNNNNFQSQSQVFIQHLYIPSLFQFPINQQYQNYSFISDNSIINNLFYGKLSPQILIQGIPIKNCQQEIFNIIQIDVNHRILIEALDKYMNQTIEYRHDNNQYQQAIKQFWIQQAPQILTFQIQRVEFHKEFGTFSKINYSFNFEKELFLDRYLLSNQETARKIQTQNQQRKDELNQINKKLEQLNQFNGNIEIIKTLEPKLQYFNTQTFIEKNHPFYVKFNENSEEVVRLQEKKKQIDLNISNSYNQLKKQKYVLQSILMHDGSYYAGHYFAYIYNFDEQKWYYFNDIIVHEETEENVLKFAFGDQTNCKSAYLIQYIQEDTLKQGQNNMKIFSNGQNQNYLKEQYGLLLSQKQKDFLQQDNQKFKKEQQQQQQQQQLNNQIITVIQLYNQYLNMGNEKQRQYQMKTYLVIPQMPPYFSNFAMYLKIKSNEQMFKWVILDEAIKKVMSQFNGLFEQPKIDEKIKNQILDEMLYDKPSSFPTNQERQASIEEYKNDIKQQSIIAYILQQYNDNKLIKTLQALHKFMKLAKQLNQQSYFYNMAIKLKQYIQIGIVCKIWQNKIINDEEKIVLKLLVAFQMQEHFQQKESKLWRKQLENLISSAINKYSQNEELNQEVLKPLIQNIKDFEICSKLDSSPQDFDQYIEEQQKLYLEKRFENNLEDSLLDTLMSNLQKFFEIRSIKLLIENIDKSTSILDKNTIQKIFQEYAQIK